MANSLWSYAIRYPIEFINELIIFAIRVSSALALDLSSPEINPC